MIPERYKDDFTDFEPLTLGSEEREALDSVHKLALESGFEHGQVRTERGFSEIFTSRDHNKVGIPEKFKTANHLDLYHSHTNVTPLSAQDFALLTRENVNSVSVIAINGDVYSVSIGNGWRPSYEEFVDAVREVAKDTDRAMMDHEMFLSWSLPERNYMAIKEQAYRIAKYFGWRLEGGRL